MALDGSHGSQQNGYYRCSSIIATTIGSREGTGREKESCDNCHLGVKCRTCAIYYLIGSRLNSERIIIQIVQILNIKIDTENRDNTANTYPHTHTQKENKLEMVREGITSRR